MVMHFFYYSYQDTVKEQEDKTPSELSLNWKQSVFKIKSEEESYLYNAILMS